MKDRAQDKQKKKQAAMGGGKGGVQEDKGIMLRINGN